MKRVVVLAGLVSAVCLGETVTIAPGNGVYTNVAARLTGETGVVVNSGATGGGIVRLSPANTYTGTTTLNSGTLLLDQPAPLGDASQIGTTGTLFPGPGTVRYAGPANGEIGHDITSACTGYGTIFDISNEVWITGTVDYSKGSFVKTGPGTLHLAGTGSNTFNKASCLKDDTSGVQAKFVPNANGDTPTKGYRGFHVLEGTLVVGERGGIFRVFGANDASIGGWTTDSGQEKEAVLEVRGGLFESSIWMMLGAFNGKTSNGSDHPPRSAVRLYDGEIRYSNTFAMGRNKMGYSKFAQLNEPHFEVYGGVANLNKGLSISDDRGANSKVLIRGGTVNATSVYTERVSGNADTKATVEVTGTGRLVSSDIYAGAVTNKGGTAFNLIITNGGYVAGTYLQTKDKSSAKFDVLIDDGTLACARTSDGWFLSARINKFEIGTRGATFIAPSGKYGGIKALITAADTFPEEEPRGVKILAPGTSQSALNVHVPVGWKGPTYVGPCARIRFYDEGALPAESPVTLAQNSRLSVSIPVTFKSLTMGGENGFGDIQLSIVKGAGITVNGPLTLLGNSGLGLSLYDRYDKDTATWVTPEAGTYPVLTVPKAYGDVLRSLRVTRGNLTRTVLESYDYVETDETVTLVYTLTTNPAFVNSDIAATNAPATTASTTWTGTVADGLWATGDNWEGGAAVNADGTLAVFPALGETTDAQTVSLGEGAATAAGLDFTGALDYTIGGGTLTLANGDNASFISSVGGAAQTVSANLSSEKRVMVNPAATGAGQVTLSGSKTGLTGGLTTGSGTTVLDSLAFVNSADDLVIGPGTLKYTGTGETIPGLTLNAGTERAAILDVENDLTVESVKLGTSSFLKMGAGTLKLAGTDFFRLGNTQKNANKKEGIGVYGDSPVDAFQYANIGEGTVEIGTVGDVADAPDVYVPGALEIGIRTASAANGRTETAGTLVMNNGTLTTGGNIEVGYYNGTMETAPEGGTHPRLVINGGKVSINEIHTVWDWGYVQNCHAEIEMNGGELEMAKGVFQCMPSPEAAQVSTAWTQNGGYAHCNGVVVGQYAKTGSVYGPFTMDLNGGIFAVTNTGAFVISNGVNATINVNDGAVFQTGSINGLKSGSNTTLRFNGGTWRGIVSATGQPTVQNVPHIYAKKTIDFDTSADMGLGTPSRYWYYIAQKIETDPEAEELVGFGIRGGGDVIFSDAFKNNTLTAPIHVTDHSGLMTRLTSLSNSDVVVDPGSTLRNYDRVSTIKNLTLGAEGGTEPVILDLNMEKSYAKTNLNIVVTGTLNVLSPVGLMTHEVSYARSFQQIPNTYTVLVYQASNSIDVSKFGTLPHEQARQITWSEVTLASGTYAGYKALVAQVTTTPAGTLPTAGTDRVWTAVEAGGAWSTAANWNNAAAAPNAEGAVAPFLAATAPNVPVNVDVPVTAHDVTLRGSAAANGYAFSGQSLRLASGSLSSSALDVPSGNHTLANPLVLGNRTTVSTISNALGNARLVIKELQGNGQTIIINRNNRSGGGEVVVEKASGVNVLATGCGRTILKDLTWAANGTHATPLQTGPGTVRYEGPSISIPCVGLNWGQNYATLLDIANPETTLEVKSITASSTGFIKTGPGDLKLTGTGSFTLGNKLANRDSNDVYERPNGDSPIYCFRNGNIGRGRIIQGTVGDATDAPNVTCADMNLGLDVNGTSYDTEYVVNNGKLTATSMIYMPYYQGEKGSCTCSFTINGGSVTSVYFRTCHTGSRANYANSCVTVNGGRWDHSSNILCGYQRNNQNSKLATTTFTVNGGEVHVGGTFYLVYFDNSTSSTKYRTTEGHLHVNGGLLEVKGLLNMNRNVNNNAYAWLSGGTFAVEGITQTRGKGYLYGNGGVLAPYGVTEANRTLDKLTAVYASTNGLVVSGANLPAGAEYVIAQAILTDPALGTTDGGFTKIGAGTVALTAENTFTGPTRVQSGVLRVTCDGALSSDVLLANAGTLDLSAGAIAVDRLSAQGTVVNGQLTVNGGFVKNPESDTYLRVDGDLTVPATAKIDFGLAADDPSPAYRVRLPLATVSGTAALPSRMKVANGGATVKAAKIELVDGVYYATPTSSGSVISIR